MSGVSATPGSVVRPQGSQLLGRRRERELLDRLLEGAGRSDGGVLVVHGEAGVGKTTLMEHAVDGARAFRVLRTTGVEGEMELPFAALEQLCSPILELGECLPAPQRDALSVAFGLSAGQAPNPFLVGLAVLGLMSEAAEERPLLCAVDDAQWLDRASARALVFVARRLLAEKITLLFVAREVGDTFAGLPKVRVEGLDARDARTLLESVLPAPLDDPVLERLILEARGNPLALLEMPRGLTPAELAGGFGLPAALPLSSQIEENFARRLRNLPRDPRRLLLLAAADPVGDPALVWRAARRLGIPESAAETVQSEGLLALGTRVAFRHPLVRSAVYRGSAPHQRREVHRALAEATDPQTDPDRRAWHRAQATSVPDGDVAAELERSAARAQARGGLAAAAAFLERASALTPEESRRSGRALAAAQAKLRIGALDEALRLVSTAESGALSELEQAKAVLLRGQISFLATRSSDASALLLNAAERLRDVDPELARETYLEALTAAIFAGPLAGPGAGAREVAEAARAAPRARKPRGPELLLDGLVTLLSDSYAAAVPILRQAHRAIERETSPAEQLRWMWGATVSTLHVWDDEGWERLADRHLQLIRETGALGELPVALSHRCQMHVFAGELRLAASLHDAVKEATELTGSPLAPYHAAGLMAMRGREADAGRFIDTARAEMTERGEGAGLSFMDWAESVLYNGLGRYAEALAAARRVVEHTELVPVGWTMPELIEAAVRVGAVELAADTDRRLTDRSRASGTDWALGIAARSHALLADDGRADDLYAEAIERLGRTRVAIDLARAHLLYGEWLRRQARRIDARDQLRTAHEMFTEFGMEAFAERARVELQATGERARKRTAETLDQLTPQESQVSRLAAQGNTNREIAAQLFISPSTVEYHLRKAFRKLDVKSRTQLANRLR
ncbi:MAG TPA: LuxR C-terminal-related transcriptional regulator [Solirubrobacteraceae bacterium]|nr:LuxR C-terminal-related transcriptional regulator [Solirubrobacteraceae bacterium]